MALRVFDTRLGAEAPLPAPRDRPFHLYVCGPTVYDGAHVGHARTYLYFDVVRRVLEAEGIRVRHVMNITDFEDKVTDRAVSLGTSWVELARKEERKFADDLRRLRILAPHARPRASAYVGRMIRVVRALERKGRTRWEGDSLLYVPRRRPDRRNFPIGAQLAQLVVDTGPRASEVERKAREFLLWRRQLAPNATWASPWGEGAPGWHLECYCMARTLLGLPVDLHGGGTDLIFPHHYDENEVALSLVGSRFAQRYLHTNFVTQRGRKMSKSTGVLVALRPVLDELGADALRYYLLSPSYREKLEWQDRELHRAAGEIARIRATLRAAAPRGAGGTVPAARLGATERAVRSALLDGLRIGDAFGALRELSATIEASGRPSFEKGSSVAYRRFLQTADRRLGLGLREHDVAG